MKAYSMIRSGPEYRSEAFRAGLAALGFEVVDGPPADLGAVRRGDVLVIWNRYGHYHEIAEHFERDGAAVIVAENGYLGADANGAQNYALSLGGHNGSGVTPTGDFDRFLALDIPIKPWRQDGRHIVVRSQRGIGRPGQASPKDWHVETMQRLRTMTARPLVLVDHPKLRAKPIRLKDVLADCWAAVTWASSIAGRALVAGVPVFIAAPHSIVEAACSRDLSAFGLEHPACDDARRRHALARLAWGQAPVWEISTGAPFRRLLDLHALARAA